MARTKKADTGAFELYLTDEGEMSSIVQVSDPLHISILNELSKTPLSMSEVADMTGKAQSTLSVHMDQLVSRGLISFEFDKNDSRRKIFRLKSRKLAFSKEVTQFSRSDSETFFGKMMDSKDFHRDTLTRFLTRIEAVGLDVSPLTEGLGREFGEYIASKIQVNKVEDVITWLQDFYERNAIGEVCIYTFMPLTIIIRSTDSYPCTITAVAAYHHGLFSELLSRVTGRKYVVTKSEIFGTDNNYHKFVIEPKEVVI